MDVVLPEEKAQPIPLGDEGHSVAVFGRWYRKGKSLLKHMNTHRAQAPQPA